MGEYIWDSRTSLPISEGTFGDGISYLNDLIAELAERYGIRHYIKIGNRFSRGSADAVQILRRIFGLRDGRDVDGELFLRMRDERRALAEGREI